MSAQERIELRLPAEEKARDLYAAELMGETLSAFMRRATREAAERVIAERNQLALNAAETEKLLDALEQQPVANERLAALFARKPVIGQ